jgi:hypothetical protein
MCDPNQTLVSEVFIEEQIETLGNAHLSSRRIQWLLHSSRAEAFCSLEPTDRHRVFETRPAFPRLLTGQAAPDGRRGPELPKEGWVRPCASMPRHSALIELLHGFIQRSQGQGRTFWRWYVSWLPPRPLSLFRLGSARLPSCTAYVRRISSLGRNGLSVYVLGISRFGSAQICFVCILNHHCSVASWPSTSPTRFQQEPGLRCLSALLGN